MIDKTVKKYNKTLYEKLSYRLNDVDIVLRNMALIWQRTDENLTYCPHCCSKIDFEHFEKERKKAIETRDKIIWDRDENTARRSPRDRRKITQRRKIEKRGG